MKDPREVIIRPVITEHSYDMMEKNTYTFEVAKEANKVEIRQAVEAIFDVTVVKVNTLNVKSKPKRVRQQAGRTRTWKKAMVTLKEGDAIERSPRRKASGRSADRPSGRPARFAQPPHPRGLFYVSVPVRHRGVCKGDTVPRFGHT